MVYGGNMTSTKTVALGPVKFGSKKIRATDPCYEKDIWCATTIEVEDEEWAAWAVVSNESDWGKRVARLILTLPRETPKEQGELLKWDCRFKGEPSVPLCGVDSGQFGFFDADQYEGKDKAWYAEICDLTLGSSDQAYLCRFGTVARSGFGDGAYPIYVRRENGKIVQITAVFIEPEDQGEVA